MFIFWMKLIVISLIFIGCQRSTATASLFDFSPHQDSLRIIKNEKEKEQSHLHNWDCQPESNYIQEQIALTTKMLHEGIKATEQPNTTSTEETVLVLGKAGSGKTSLVQFLTKNLKLLSKIVDINTGEYIIEDEEKIGTSATESFTLYPEFVSYNTTINFCDSPGFHDSRSSAHEIVSMDFMKSATKKFENVKILLLENHSSLQYGISKDSFINTLRHLNDFIVDIDKYKDHIALIATKTPLVYRITDESGSKVKMVTDEMHIESIVKYLNQTEKSLEEKAKLNLKISRKERDFYKKVIRLLQSLQTKDENGHVPRINVFRRPYKSGPLTTMNLLEENRKSLLDTVMKLEVVEVEENDFDFTLSNEAKLYLECILKLTGDNYKNKINELSVQLNEYVNHKTQNYSSFHQVLSDMDSFYIALKQLSQNLDKTKNYNEFFENVNWFISDQKMTVQFNCNERLGVLERYEEILMKFVDTSILFNSGSWTIPIRQVINSTEYKLEWYQTLNKFIDGLSSHEIQKNKTEIYKTVFNFNATTTKTDGLMLLFMHVTGNLHQYINALADEKKKSEIELIANSLLQDSNNITCDSDGRLIVKGFHLCLTEIDLKNLVQLHCNDTTLKEVALMAVDSVFLDEDKMDDILKGVNLFIAAPQWKVIGQRSRIVLSGNSGPKISDDPYLDNGKDGKPGLPGENGGSFFGIGLQFINGKNLRIELNGGRGGSGADGAKGDKGEDGKDAVEKLKLSISTNITKNYTSGIHADTLLEYFNLPKEEKYFVLESTTSCQGCKTHTVKTEIQIVMDNGDCGGRGSPGGLGGGPGIGGFAGKQVLIELGDASEIQFEMNNGGMGENGNMGLSGDQGLTGEGVLCINVVGFVDRYKGKSYWKCELMNSILPFCSEDIKYYQNNNYTTVCIKYPTPKKSTDFSYYLLDYAILLKTHSNHTIFNKIITDFKEAIQRKYSYNLDEMGLLFFKNKE